MKDSFRTRFERRLERDGDNDYRTLHLGPVHLVLWDDGGVHVWIGHNYYRIRDHDRR